MDFKQRLQEHERLIEKVRTMEAQLEDDRREQLASLPSEFGFEDLGSFIRALRSAVAGATHGNGKARKPQGRNRRMNPANAPRARPANPSIPINQAMRPTTTVSTGATGISENNLSIAPAPVASPQEKPENTLPAGTSLDDPANFGLLPDRTMLESGTRDAHEHREKLVEALRFATQVLHTSKVPAVVWREWRRFERQITDALRVL